MAKVNSPGEWLYKTGSAKGMGVKEGEKASILDTDGTGCGCSDYMPETLLVSNKHAMLKYEREGETHTLEKELFSRQRDCLF